MEQITLADIAPERVYAFVTRLFHDRMLRGPLRGGARYISCAEAMTRVLRNARLDLRLGDSLDAQ